MKALISPVQVFPKTATKLYINNVSVQLGQSASFQWWLQTNDNELLTNGVITIEGQDYLSWNDDTYLYNYAANQIGVTITGME